MKIIKSFGDLELPDPNPKTSINNSTSKSSTSPPVLPPTIEPPPSPPVKEPPPPKINKPPIVDDKSVDDNPSKGPIEYFINLGFVTYNGGNSVLMGRQVLPFADVGCGKYWNRAVCYTRYTIKMTTPSVGQFGEMVKERRNTAKVGDWEELDNDSYAVKIRAEGIFGFAGRIHGKPEHGLSFLEMRSLVDRVQCATAYLKQPTARDSSIIWPVFLTECEAGTAKAKEQFDVSTGKWRWMRELEGASPVTIGCPGVVSDDLILRLERFLYWKLLCTGLIYIGMCNMQEAMIIRPEFEPPAFPVRPEWQTEVIPFEWLGQSLDLHDIKLLTWAFPSPRENEPEYARRALTQWTRSKINKMLGAA